jgi:outer membrane protein TolC
VISTHTTHLVNRQALVKLRIQPITVSVQLVGAVGGGWNTSQMPRQLLSRIP